MTVHANNSGAPADTVLYMLTTPSSVSSISYETFTFTAPPGATLAANTTYWVRFSTSNTIEMLVPITEDDSVDRIDSGWSYGTRSYKNGPAAWANRSRKFQMALQVDLASPERLEAGDLPASKDTYMSIGVGQTAVASLSSSSDTDWIKFEGLQNRKQYRFEVEFLGTGATGGGFSFHSGNPRGHVNPNSSFWGSNWSGNAVLDFKVLDAHVNTYWVEIVSPNGENVGDVTYNSGSITIDHDPSTIHVGGYVVTLTEIGHVEKVVSNLDQGYEGQYNQAVVGHRYSEGLDKGHQRFLGYFTNFASGFTTGPNNNGYSLDRVEAQIQMGLTKIIGLQPSIAISYIVTFSRARLLVTEGDTNGSTYTVKLGAQPSEDVVVAITGQSGTDLTVTPTSLTFTTANWDQEQTVTVTAASDSDDVNDDVILTHTPTGEEFLVTALLAVRVDDDEDSATAELPDAPTSSIHLPARPAPLLSPTARRTNATPVISLFGDDNLPYPRLCSFKSNAAYTSRLYSPGPADTDVIYAGDCADVTLRPNSKYWLVFENYNEIPRSSAFNADDFYYVARAKNVNEDGGGGAGWDVTDEAIFDRYIPNDHKRWKEQISSLPAMMAVYASPRVPDGTYNDWVLRTESDGSRSTHTVGTPAVGPEKYVIAVKCDLIGINPKGLHITVHSDNDPDWPPQFAASMDLDIGASQGGSDLFDGFLISLPPVVSGVAFAVGSYPVSLINALLDNAPEGLATLTLELYATNMGEFTTTGTRVLEISLDGAHLTIPVVQQYCSDAQGQQAAPDTSAQGAPAINGTAEVDRTLTAVTTGITDADGLQNVAFAYQWLADDVEISGATSVTYTPDAGYVGKAIKVRVDFTDDAGNVESLTSAPTPAVEAADLALQSATVDGSTLTLTYNETLDVAAVPSKSAFTVNVNGVERSIFIVGLGGSNVLLTLSTAVESGDTVTVAYAKPDGANVIKDTDGNEAGSFSAQAVTNNTAAPVTEKSDPVQAPGSLNVARHESGKLSASWTAPASGPTPTGYTVQWKESGDDWATAADVSEANVKGTSHVITGLTDGTEYAVRVMARKGDDDSGPSAEVTATPQETVPSRALVGRGERRHADHHVQRGSRHCRGTGQVHLCGEGGGKRPGRGVGIRVGQRGDPHAGVGGVFRRRGHRGLHGTHGGVGRPGAGPGG